MPSNTACNYSPTFFENALTHQPTCMLDALLSPSLSSEQHYKLYRAGQEVPVCLICRHPTTCLCCIRSPLSSPSSRPQPPARRAATAARGSSHPQSDRQCTATRPASLLPSYRVSSAILTAVRAERPAADSAAAAAGHSWHAGLPATFLTTAQHSFWALSRCSINLKDDITRWWECNC